MDIATVSTGNDEPGGPRTTIESVNVEPQVLTVMEAARVLRIGRNQAYGLVRRGEIQAIRCGRSWRIPRESLVAFLASGD
jgi:excisionase family DNA binding protein